MLFKNLYNWIKYKSLPTSYLFKNRLFIERDSKYRRIINNFGLVFRSSLWGNFELVNIKKIFKKNYMRFIMRACIFLIILFFFIYRKYFNELPVTSTFYFCVWYSIDILNYWSTFIIWLFLFTYYTISCWFLSYFLDSYFFYFYNTRDEIEDDFFEKYHEERKLDASTVMISDLDMRYVVYNWLCSDDEKIKSKLLKVFFSSKTNKQIWKKFYLYFIKLYRTVYFFNVINYNCALKVNIAHIYFEQKNTLIANTKFFYFNKIFYWNRNKYLSNYYSTKKIKCTLKLFRTLHSWNLVNLNKNSIFLSNNNIYFKNLNFNILNKKLYNFTTLFDANLIIKTNLDVLKWNRWLYKYSILHRRLLKNSNKLSNTKRVMQTGLFDKSAIKRNAWLSGKAKKLTKNIGGNVFLARNFFFLNSASNFKYNLFNDYNKLFHNSNKFLMLSFYENSFFWYNKRFYLNSSLLSNFVNDFFLKNVNFNSEIYSNNHSIIHLDYINRISSSNLLHLSELSYTNNFVNFFHTASTINNIYTQKDLFLILQDEELLNNENLDTLFFITSNSGSSKHLPYINFCNYLNLDLNNSKSFFSTPELVINNFDYFIFYYYNNTKNDNIFLNDLLKWNYFM